MKVLNFEAGSTRVSHRKRVRNLLLGYAAMVTATNVTCIHLGKAYVVSTSNSARLGEMVASVRLTALSPLTSI